ncbi:uncharacterized protein J4E88_001916 [Alternaria novae-zelandiae]|uniref:uncharacterized protein n=1 Tax=Alternaria novae-zelandiae TaxID=430562 RepID=UPI0020C49B56|nr:uncharacterized protein J4E88_001916 [Alternaria novae-zelandiae]KAI4693543.1 hypothetical protein J4E88_001916 [Alternaria novae-zelandiae]
MPLREPERNQVQEQPSQPVAELEGDVTADAEIHLVDLHAYIRFRNEDGDAVPRDVHDLPQPVQTALEDRFKAMWDCKEGRVKEYGRITSKPELYTDKEYCIRNLIIRGSRVRGTMFGHGGKHKKSACDKCINSGHPCAHVIKVNDEFGKLFVPLPRALRKGQNWDELGYWVVEK